MMLNSKIATFRVTYIHRNGYTAPTFYVEVSRGKNERITKRKAVKAAKQYSRLGDFPKIWYCRLTDVSD